MKKENHTLLNAIPFVCLLIGAQALEHAHIGWVLGGAVWLLTSRLYLVPRRLQRLSDTTAPSLLGSWHGPYLRALLGILYITHFSLLFIQILQKGYKSFSMLQKIFNSEYLNFDTIDPTTCLIIIAIIWLSILVFALLYNNNLWQSTATLILLTSFILLPFIVHKLRDQFDLSTILGLLQTSQDAKRNIGPSILIITCFIGHPLLSHQLLENHDKRNTMRLFKIAATILICFSIVTGFVTQKLPSLKTASEPKWWYMILAIYHLTHHTLSASMMLYMITLHVAHDVLHLNTSSKTSCYKAYLLAALISTLLVTVSFIASQDHIHTTYLITLPFIAITQFLFVIMLMGLYPSKTNTYIALASAPTLQIILESLHWNFLQPYTLLIAFATSALTLLIVHYIQNEGFALRKRNWWERKDVEELAIQTHDIKKAILDILLFPIRMATYARQSLAKQRIPFKSLSVYLSLISLLGIQLWPIPSDAPYLHLAYILFAINLIACVIALMISVWPKVIIPYYPLYWHLWLTFYFVTTPIIYYIASNHDTKALANLIIGTLLLARFVNPLSFSIMHLFGLLGSHAILHYFSQTNLLDLFVETNTHRAFLYSYLLAYLVGILFIRKSQGELEETRDKLKSLVKKSISIISNALNITQSHASMIELCSSAMDVTEEPDKPEDNTKEPMVLISMQEKAYVEMKDNLSKLLASMDRGKSQLKRVFLPIEATIKRKEFNEYQASPCVQEAIQTFMRDYEAPNKPQLHIEEDFTFFGSDQALISVIIQLIKNGYENSQSQDPITLQVKNNKIYVINKASNISKADLPHIFNEYFTTNPENLGLGLYYAKLVIQAFGGNITCKTSHKEDTIAFILHFPVK